MGMLLGAIVLVFFSFAAGYLLAALLFAAAEHNRRDDP